jgi:hypothetical protein
VRSEFLNALSQRNKSSSKGRFSFSKLFSLSLKSREQKFFAALESKLARAANDSRDNAIFT